MRSQQADVEDLGASAASRLEPVSSVASAKNTASAKPRLALRLPDEFLRSDPHNANSPTVVDFSLAEQLARGESKNAFIVKAHRLPNYDFAPRRVANSRGFGQ